MVYLSQLVILVWIVYDCSENDEGSMNSVCMNCTTNEMLVNEVYIYIYDVTNIKLLSKSAPWDELNLCKLGLLKISSSII